MPEVLSTGTLDRSFLSASAVEAEQPLMTKDATRGGYDFNLLVALRKGTRRVEANEVLPQKYILNRKRKRIYDLCNTENSIILVSDRMRCLIEHFDPDTHQFFPVKLAYKNGSEPTDESYFIINIYNTKQTVDVDQPSVKKIGPRKDAYRSDMVKSYPMVFRPSALEGTHLWREKDFSSLLFISDNLYAAIKRDKLQTFPKDRRSVMGMAL